MKRRDWPAILPLALLILAGIACGSIGTTTPTPARPLPTVVPTWTPALPVIASPTGTTAPPDSGAQVKTAANLRAGPGTGYARIGSLAPGQALDIVARNPAGDWYQLASGAWIAAFLVADPPAGVPVTTLIPTPEVAAPAPLRAAATVPTARDLPAAAASDCDCDHGNTLNCADFADSWDAQSCYLRCMELKHLDIHGLDRDSDGDACEWQD